MICEEITTCESLDLALPALPQRSRLHSQAPIGAGSGAVESLTGYIARLGEAQNVSVAVLFGWELAPKVENSYLQHVLQNPNKAMVLAISFTHLSRAMNGGGETARAWIKALEAETMSSGLSQLTMVIWSEVISHRHLIRAHRAWCPSCYEEWLAASLSIYEPLQWTLRAITACPQHHRRLRDKCHHCGRKQQHLASHSRPGFCSNCRKWLGVPQSVTIPSGEQLTDTDLRWQLWATEAIGKMLSAAALMTEHPPRKVIACSITNCIDHFEDGNISAFSRKCRFPKQTIGNWRRGDHVPTLEAVLRLCYGIGISPFEFLTGTLSLDDKSAKIVSERQQRQIIDSKERDAVPRRHRKIELKETRRLLRAVLRESPPPTGKEVALRIDRPPSALRYQFPQLWASIVKRYQDYKAQSRQDELRRAQLALEAALIDEHYPSVIDVARATGWGLCRLLRRFPQLCHDVSARHIMGAEKHWEKIELVLKEILDEQPPPPMREVVRRINYSGSSLYKHFPELCRSLSARYKAFRKQNFQTLREQFLMNVRQIAMELSAEGIYPSVKQVERRLNVPKSLRSHKAALEVLRKVRDELGLNPPKPYPTWF